MAKKNNYVQMVVTIALLVALHIILSRFLSINAWNIKIGFAFAAIFIAAYLFGPVGAAITGALGDLLGAILFPIGPYFPGFTLTCLLTGLLYGLLLHKKQTWGRIIAAAAINNLILSLLLNSYWIALVYGTPFAALLATRGVQVAILIPVEIITMKLLSGIMDRINAKKMVGMDKQTEIMEKRKALRKEKIAAREALTPEEHEEKNRAIAYNLSENEIFKNSKTILSYVAVKGEVNVSEIEKISPDKMYCYPRVISNEEMVALAPFEGEEWGTPYYGIPQPAIERSKDIKPEEIDLVIAPCTGFDENCGRIGMGAGYYDRFLAKCVNAKTIAVAYECQKADDVYMQKWDQKTDAVITESNTYVAKK